MEAELRKIYYKKSGKYKSIERLWNYVRAKIFGIKYKQVVKFVEKQQSYQLTKQYKKPGTSRKGRALGPTDDSRGNGFTTVRAPEAGTNLQIDLMFFNPERESNGTVSYTGVLNVLDVHSRYAWSRPIRDKRAKTVKKEFKKIIKEIEADKGAGAVKNMNQDDGKEFMGVFKQYVDGKNITLHISARDDFAKNPIVERWNRTLREIMEKFEIDYPGQQILQQWDKIIRGYNTTYHKTIKATPMQVWKGKKPNTQKYYDVEYDFKKGDRVRVLRKKTLVEKGKYAWKPGLYTIHKKKKRGYILKDDQGSRQARRYMGYELQKVSKTVQVSKQYSKKKADKARAKKDKAKAKKKQSRTLAREGVGDVTPVKRRLRERNRKPVEPDADESYTVEKVLGRRKRNNRYEYLVQWKGYDDQTWEQRKQFGSARSWQDYDRAHPIRK